MLAVYGVPSTELREMKRICYSVGHFQMASVLLKCLQERHLPQYNGGPRSQQHALLSATHEIALYVFLQHNDMV